MLCERAGLSEELRSLYARLMVVPPDTPLPMTMLKRLWNLETEDKAEATASLFEKKVWLLVADPVPMTNAASSVAQQCSCEPEDCQLRQLAP